MKLDNLWVADIIDKHREESIAPEKIEYKHLGTFLRTRSLKLYSFNPITNHIEKVNIKSSNTIHVVYKEGRLISVDYEFEKVMVDSQCIFFEALNDLNANKHVARWRQGRVKELCNLRIPGEIKFY